MATKRERKLEARHERLSKSVRDYVRAVVKVDATIDEHFGGAEGDELRRAILGLGLGGLPLTAHDVEDLILAVVNPAVLRELPSANSGPVASLLSSEELESLAQSLESLILSLPWTYVVSYPLFRCDPDPNEQLSDMLAPQGVADFVEGLAPNDLPLESRRLGPVDLGSELSVVKPAAGELSQEYEDQFVWMLATYSGYWPQVAVGCSVVEAARRDAQKLRGLLLATGSITYSAVSEAPPASDRYRPEDAPLQLKYFVRNRKGERRSAQLIRSDNNRANDLRPTRRLRGVAASDQACREELGELTCDTIFRLRLRSIARVVADSQAGRTANGESRSLSERLLLAGYWLAESDFAAITAANQLLFMVLSLEALLGEPELEHGIQDRLADRLAFYVGETEAQRVYLRRTVKDVYALRSRIVHRGVVEHDELQLAMQTHRLRPMLSRVICRLLGEVDIGLARPVAARSFDRLH